MGKFRYLAVNPVTGDRIVRLHEMLELGYELADRTFERGYVSRKVDINEQIVYEAQGRRKGDMYVKIPCWESTKYFYRQYLKMPVK